MTNEIKYLSPQEIIVKLKMLIKIIEQSQGDIGNEITHAQARVIFPIIKDGKGYTIQELSDMGGVTKGLVSRTIADLEEKGYVERDKKTENQDRNFKIILSVKGQQFVTDKKAQMQKDFDKWHRKLKHEDLLAFIKVLDVVTDMQEEK